MRILVVGGKGFIGSALKAHLQKAHEVWILTRQKNLPKPYLSWDGKTLPPDLPDVDVLINLSGQNIMNRRWSPAYKKQLLLSRVLPTQACITWLRQQKTYPLYLQASAVGYYGAQTETVVEETAPPGKDFLAQLCQQWEKIAQESPVPPYLLRFGIVLGRGGALTKLLMPFQWGIAPILGSGEQPFSWIHIHDVVESILFLIEKKPPAGPYNLVAPNWVTYKELIETLRRLYPRRVPLSVPEKLLSWFLGERAELLTKGQKAYPRQLLNAGYTFRYPTIEAALRNLLS
ncbi:MAG: TIGR01777 family oxidoreductase [Bacteroidia bacterium]